MKTIIQNQAKQSSIYETQFGTITQLVITQNFQLFVGPIPITWCSFYFFFPFFFPPSTPNTPNPVKKNKKQKNKSRNPNSLNPVKEEGKKKDEEDQTQRERENKKRRRSHLVWKEKEKKEDEETKLTEPSEGKKKRSKVAVDFNRGTLYVVLITKMPLKTDLWKLKTPKMCFQFP